MSNQTEELLRAGMDRFTSDVTVPSGLAVRAAAHRQRRKRVTAATIGGVIAVAGITVASVLTVAARTPATGQTRTAAYVISRTETALAAVSQQTFIQQVHETISGQLPGWPADAYPGSVTLWSYRDHNRIASFGPGGQLTGDQGEQEIGNQRVFTTVNYRARTWWRNSMTSPWVSPTPEDGCSFADAIEGAGNIENHDWATEIRTALSCGVYTVAGAEQVDGAAAIKLTPVRSPQTPNGTMTTVFWVDPATYLPVRDRTTVGTTTVTDEFRWLPPTAANLRTSRCRSRPDSPGQNPVKSWRTGPGRGQRPALVVPYRLPVAAGTSGARQVGSSLVRLARNVLIRRQCCVRVVGATPDQHPRLIKRGCGHDRPQGPKLSGIRLARSLRSDACRAMSQ